jgi:hypothetical protein
MSGARIHSLLLCSIVLFLVLISAGCMTVGVGDVIYTGSELLVSITNTGDPSEAHIQVTVYEVKDLRQHEIAVLSSPAMLGNGPNTIAVPGQIEPGQYKLYIYVIQNGSRKTAVIRDIVVT